MNYIVFDLEWNMSNPWDKVDPEQAKAMPYEIIEIGAVKLNEQGGEEGHFSLKIRPVLHTRLNRHVGQVTHRSPESLKTGYPFVQAMESFRRFCGDDYCLASWSDSDTEPLKRNLAFHGLDNELGVRVLDVQRAFAHYLEGGHEQRSVAYALDFLRLDKKLPFHVALSDARYTAWILREILQVLEQESIRTDDLLSTCSFDPDIRRSSIWRPEPFDTSEALMEAVRNADYHCPHCDALLRVLEDWDMSGRTAQATYCCARHGEVRLRCRPRRGRENKWLGQVHLKLLRS